MDVKLPNGQVVTNVPDGMSKEELKRRLIESGKFSEADFVAATETPAKESPSVMDVMSGANQNVLEGLLAGAGDEVTGALGALARTYPAELLQGLLSGGVVGAATGAMSGVARDAATGNLGRLGEAYDEQVAEARADKAAFAEQNPNLALGLNVGGALFSPALGALGAARAVRAVQGANATRGAQMAAGAAAGALEGGAYAVASKEGGFGERLSGLDERDALIVGLSAVTGGVGGAFLRAPGSAQETLGAAIRQASQESPSVNFLRASVRRGGAMTRDTASAVGDATYQAFAKVAPETAEAASRAASSVSRGVKGVRDAGTRIADGIREVNARRRNPMANAADSVTDPARRGPIQDTFDVHFQPVKDLAETRVSRGFGQRLNRGAIRGQQQATAVDNFFSQDDVVKLTSRLDAEDVETQSIRQLIADRVNYRLPKDTRAKKNNLLRAKLGEEDFKTLTKIMEWQKTSLRKMRGTVQNVEVDEDYLHVARIPKETPQPTAGDAVQAKARAVSARDSSAKAKAKAQRTKKDGSLRKEFAKEKQAIQNPLRSHHDWLRLHTMVGEMNGQLGIRAAQNADELAEVADGTFFNARLAEKLEGQGLSPKAIEEAQEIYKQVVYGSQQAMSDWAQTVRNVGYASTIANFYGAFLQIADMFANAFVNGSGNTFRALLNKDGFNLTAKDVGLMSNHLNEVVRRSAKGRQFSRNDVFAWAADRSQSLLDTTMGISFFRDVDAWTKSKVMNAALGREFRDLAADPAAWREKWKHTFGPEELPALELSLRKKRTNSPLVRDLAMINLSDLQPISPASSALRQLQFKNGRLLYMLKGFSMTQMQLVRSRILKKLKTPGQRAEGLKDAMAYAVMTGGGFGVVNETRQLLKGEAPDYSAENIAWQGFYHVASVASGGVISPSDYGFRRALSSPVLNAADYLVPAMPLVEGAGKDLGEVFNEFDFAPDQTLKAFPFIGPLFRAVENILSEED